MKHAYCLMSKIPVPEAQGSSLVIRATACAGIHLGPSASLPWDSGARTMDTSLLMLMLIAVLGVIKVFVPGLRVSRLLPASAKLAGQTH